MAIDHIKADSDAAPVPDGLVSISRWRWDIFFFGAVSLTALLGVTFYVFTDEVSSLCSPLSVILLWIAVRWGMPKHGTTDRRISAVPGAIWMIASLATLTGYYVFSTFIMGKSPNEPLELLDIVVWMSMGVVIFGGFWAVNRRYPSAG